jgi:hypothetical protein
MQNSKRLHCAAWNPNPSIARRKYPQLGPELVEHVIEWAKAIGKKLQFGTYAAPHLLGSSAGQGFTPALKKKRDNPIDKITRQARLGDLR